MNTAIREAGIDLLGEARALHEDGHYHRAVELTQRYLRLVKRRSNKARARRKRNRPRIVRIGQARVPRAWLRR